MSLRLVVPARSFKSRVYRTIINDGGDVPRRAGQVFGAIRKCAWRNGPHRSGAGIALEAEKRDRAWYPVLGEDDLLSLQIGDG